MANNLNPFARSQMKFTESVRLVSCTFNGWSSCYQIEYRATRGAANAGLLAKQFKIGTPLFVQGKHVVVRNFELTLTGNTVDEVTVRVEAVNFEMVLAGLAQSGPAGSNALPPTVPIGVARNPAPKGGTVQVALGATIAPVIPGNFGAPRRRILK